MAKIEEDLTAEHEYGQEHGHGQEYEQGHEHEQGQEHDGRPRVFAPMKRLRAKTV